MGARAGAGAFVKTVLLLQSEARACNGSYEMGIKSRHKHGFDSIWTLTGEMPDIEI